MATDFIDQLRTGLVPDRAARRLQPRRPSTPTSAELADWLETGGDDQSRAALVQREMERVGERTGAILSAAQESADRITSRGQRGGGEARAEAEREASESARGRGRLREGDARRGRRATRARSAETADARGRQTPRPRPTSTRG